MKNNSGKNKTLAPGIGLIFGVAIGGGLGIIFNNIPIGAGFGAAVGLILGAVIQAYRKD